MTGVEPPTAISLDDAGRLLHRAQSAAATAYAPYSGFHVGAALLATDGRVVTGANVENASYGLTICAERVAIVKAVSEGVREFVALAVTTVDGAPCTPCGACRQVMHEFNPSLVVVMAGAEGPRMVTLGALLPDAFDFRA